MIEVVISPKMLVSARDKAADMGRLQNSITNGAGNLAGFIGELIALKVLGGKQVNTFDYDIITKDGIKVDVKTKRTSVKPLLTYDCSIAALNTKQDCDYYAFVRVKNDFTIGWYLGVYGKEAYMQDSIFMEKGTIDTSNGFVVKSDCYNLQISELKEKI
jgi:hypothetical protein